MLPGFAPGYEQEVISNTMGRQQAPLRFEDHPSFVDGADRTTAEARLLYNPKPGLYGRQWDHEC